MVVFSLSLFAKIFKIQKVLAGFPRLYLKAKSHFFYLRSVSQIHHFLFSNLNLSAHAQDFIISYLGLCGSFLTNFLLEFFLKHSSDMRTALLWHLPWISISYRFKYKFFYIPFLTIFINYLPLLNSLNFLKLWNISGT